MVHAECIFVAGIHPSIIWMSTSFESMRWNACVHRLDLILYSHPKEFWGNGVGTHFNSKGKIPSTRKILLRGRSNLQHCTKQDSKPNTLPMSYSDPKRGSGKDSPALLHPVPLPSSMSCSRQVMACDAQGPPHMDVPWLLSWCTASRMSCSSWSWDMTSARVRAGRVATQILARTCHRRGEQCTRWATAYVRQ